MSPSKRTPPQEPLRVLSLGWGVQSWTLAAMTALGELPPLDYAVHADTTWEAQGTYEHAMKWTPWLGEHGVKVVTVRATNNDVAPAKWSDSVMIPAFTTDLRTGKEGQMKRQCTSLWKVRAIRAWVRQQASPRPGAVVQVLGISFDEFERMHSSDVRYITNEYPLVDRRITRKDCVLWLQNHGLDVPPKSACVFCPFRSGASWKAMKRANGSDWKIALAVDAQIRDNAAQHGQRLFVHGARVPLAEAVVIPEDHGAKQGAFEFEKPCDGGYCYV